MARLIDYLKNFLFFKLLTIYLRYIMGYAFVFASIVKIQGERFTILPTSNPVGYFFDAMYRTGFYWNFLGISQCIAGALLMSQRFSTIGALMFFPVILNVFLITVSLDFGIGTCTITTLMTLGTIYLLLWDYRKYSILFQSDHTIHLDLSKTPRDEFMTDNTWTITGVLFVLITAAPRIFSKDVNITSMLVMVLSLLIVGIAAFIIVMIRTSRRRKQMTAREPLSSSPI